MATQTRPKLLLVAMLLATVVLAACGGDESERPPETPTPANEPTATAGLPAPTPTVQPASATPTVQPGSATPQAIDTSDWLTHTSPLGFTIQYPPDWRLEEGRSHLRIVNPIWVRAAEDLIARGLSHGGPVPGMASFNVLFDKTRAMDVAYQTEFCERPPRADLSRRDAHAQVTTFAGRTAVFCAVTTFTETGIESARSVGLTFDLQPGQKLSASGGYLAPGNISIAEAILRSLKLLDGIQLSPPASPR